MAEHMLQTAAQAAAAGAPAALITAPLMHDIGRLTQGIVTEREEDLRHEVGAEFLGPHFWPEVCDPVHLNVAAKRYPCPAEPDYFDKLSPASVRTLVLQGGPMAGPKRAAFETEPDGRQAVRLSRWDEARKTPERHAAGFDHYLPVLAALVRD